MAQTMNQLEKRILELYSEDDLTFPETALKMIDNHMAQMKPSTSKVDPDRLGSRVVFISKLRQKLLGMVDPLDVELPDGDNTAKSEFNKMNIKQQVKFQSQARATNRHKWVHSLDIVPRNLRLFQVSDADTAAYQAMRQKSDTAKLRDEMEEVDADKVMAKLCPALSNPNAGRRELAAALLLVTGRRTAEILKTAELHLRKDMAMNGYEAMFTGQTKEGLNPVGTYAIPLLAPYWLVKNALNRLRTLYDTRDMDLDAINTAYSKTLNNYVAKAVGMNPHGLRAVYALSTWELSGKKVSLIGWVSRVLGHAQATSAVAYQRIKIANLSGPWTVEEEGVDLEFEAPTDEPADWVLNGAVERKRFEGIQQMMEKRIPITATSIRAQAGGSMPVAIRIVANNQDLIDAYNASLKE